MYEPPVESWSTVERILLTCLERDEAEWGEAVEAACCAHPELSAALRQRVEQLRQLGVVASASRPGAAPTRIGSFRIVRELGRGGMGVVHLAEQTDPLRRQVALKLMIAPDSERLRARFESEMQALARMRHEGIARVFEAGSTEEGNPYIAMEYVPGTSITEFCDKHRCDSDRRLELFAQVCDAMQHAHENGVLHRDLKPGNILVEEAGGRPTPKVIDFGIAKATQGQLSDRALETLPGMPIGTPEYMSPEQAAGLELGPATDVYSLGVVLYELLVGALPFSSRELRDVTWHDAVRRIREVEPPRPSTRVVSTPDTGQDAAAKRQTTPAELVRVLRRDLDWIALRAVAKQPEERYASCRDLAADLRRYLSGEPVHASASNVVQRLRKRARWHWKQLCQARRTPLAAAVVGVPLLLAVGFGVWAWSEVGGRAAAGAKRDQVIAAYLSLRHAHANGQEPPSDAVAVIKAHLPAGLRDAVLADPLAQGMDERYIGWALEQYRAPPAAAGIELVGPRGAITETRPRFEFRSGLPVDQEWEFAVHVESVEDPRRVHEHHVVQRTGAPDRVAFQLESAAALVPGDWRWSVRLAGGGWPEGCGQFRVVPAARVRQLRDAVPAVDDAVLQGHLVATALLERHLAAPARHALRELDGPSMHRIDRARHLLLQMRVSAILGEAERVAELQKSWRALR